MLFNEVLILSNINREVKYILLKQHPLYTHCKPTYVYHTSATANLDVIL